MGSILRTKLKSKFSHYGAWLLLSSTLLCSGYVHAHFEAFTIDDIRLDGLRRIDSGTVYNYFPVNAGDYLTPKTAESAIATLFKTQLFNDIQLNRDGNTLIIKLQERPAIASITFVGNKDIDAEQLKGSLKEIGFAEGYVFNQSLLDKVEQELKRQYFSLGKYSSQLKTTLTPLPRNRIGVQLDISEGVSARIKQINLIGNKVFDNDDLLDQLSLSTSGMFSFITNNDQYSKQKLAGDLETLRSFYHDQGYINFNIESTQVSLTPDKKDVYLTLNMIEGEKHTISEIRLVGDLIVAQAELMEKVKLTPGDIFSRKLVNETVEELTNRIGDEGYAFARINPVPDINQEGNTVKLTFFVDSGKRTYVRRINFLGNTRTRDEVLRREMRQMEGGWASNRQIKRSQERLERLNYFDQVIVDTPLVVGTDDQIDVNYQVTEKASGNLLAGVGYSQTEGVLFNANISQDNFLGTGKRIGLGFNNSKYNTLYRLSYQNPYSNIHGVSRGFDIFYRTVDAQEANLSRYITDVYGFKLNHGIPISEYNSINLGLAVDSTQLKTTESSAQEVFDFIQRNGNKYNSYRLTASWAKDTRNRALFPDRGTLSSFGAELAIPPSDLKYYKVKYRHQWLYPLTKDYVFSWKGDISYGDGYGGSKELPFFENYTGGGPRSVRGFEENTLGPLDSKGYPLGGNLRVTSSSEVVFPVPFMSNIRSFRLSTFLDVGNVYGTNEDFDLAEMRYSVGVAAIWASPLGILGFSYAKPLNSKDGDQTKAFQFYLGTTY